MMTIAYSFAGLYLLWPFYLAVMALKRARDAGRLTLPAKILGAPILYTGWALDIACNLLPMTLILLELPQWGEWTVTARLKRHKDDPGYRGKVARWMAANLLDAYDPDGHHI